MKKLKLLSYFYSLLLIIALSAIPSRAVEVTVGNPNATDSTNIYPFQRVWGGENSQILISASELGTSPSFINSVSFDLRTNANATAMQNFSVKMQNTTLNQTTATLINSGFTTVFAGPTWSTETGTGWKTITFNEPFFWDGSSNLLMEICWTNNASNGGVGERYVRGDSTALNTVTYKRVDNASNCDAIFSSTNAVYASRFRPVMKLEVIPATSPYITSAPTALQFNFVETEVASTPQTISIGGGNLNPATGSFLLTTDPGFEVSTNNGATWSQEATLPYVGNPIATPLPVKVRFAPLAVQNFTGTLNIQGGGATRIVNLAGTSVLSYCNPTITGTTGMDIANITIGNLNHTSQAVTPTLNNTASNQTYNNYRDAQPAINVQAGTTVPYSFRLISSTSASTTYLKVYVDLNRDGVINPVTERVDSVYTLSTNLTATNNTYTSNLIIPPTAVVGQNTLMRFLLTTIATTQPCGSYANGETEDYWVNFSDAPPYITTNPATLDFGFFDPGVVSDTKTITIGGDNLNPASGTFTVESSDGYQISTDGGVTWTQSQLTVNYIGNPISAPIAIMVRFVPTLEQEYPGTLTINGGSASKIVNLTGSGKLIYCTSNATNTADQDIGNFRIGWLENPILNNTTSPLLYSDPTANKTFSDFTSTIAPITLQAGMFYPVSVSISNLSTNAYSSKVNVYIDYNRNGVFDVPQEIAFTVPATGSGSGLTSDTWTGIIKIPSDVNFGGTTTMRVVVDEQDVAAPCGTYTWGETEDYLVQFTPSLPMTYASTSTEQVGKQIITAGSANEKMLRVKVTMNNSDSPLTLNRIVFNTNGTNPTSALNGAQVFFTADTATFNTNTPIATVNEEPNGVLNFVAEGTFTFKPGDNYLWLVYSVSSSAGVDAVLDAELTGLYISDAPTVNKITTPQAPEGFSLVNRMKFDGTFSGGVQALPYEGWTNLVLYGTSTSNKWSSVTAGLNPANAPRSAPSMAHYDANMILSANAAAMISPAFAMNGTNEPTSFSLWLYRHQSSTTGGGSRFKVYINTTPDLTNATLLRPIGYPTADSINVRYNQGLIPEPAIGWYNYSYAIPTEYNGATNYLVFAASSDYYNNIHLDDIKFGEEAYMAVAKIDTLNTGNDVFARGTVNNLVNAFNVRTIASNKAFKVDNIKFTPQGTTNLASINNAKVWYTGSVASFNPATNVLYGTVATIANGQNIVVRTVDSAITLAEGNNYFAITYDVPANAAAGTIVDCKVDAITLSRDGEATERLKANGNTWGTHEIKLPLNGTYTVGGTPLASRWYPNLVNIVDEINLLGLSANIEIKIAGDLAIDPNNAPILLPIDGSYSVNIYPTTNVNITSAYTGTLGMLAIAAADNVTIDGRINRTGSTRGLTFTNTANGRNLMLTTTTTNEFINNANIKYCNFVGNDKTSSSSIAIQLLNGRHTDVNINNCDFKKVYYGIYMVGGTDTTKAQNLTIENNNFGDALVDANSIGLYASYLGYAENVQYNSNIIENINSTLTFNAVYLVNNITNSVFSNNKINKLINTSTGRSGAFYVNSIANSNITFHSNSISGINNKSTAMTSTPAAFYFNSGSNYKVINNSVRLNGNRSTLSTSQPSSPSAVMYIASGVSALDIRNNIFVNDLECTVATLKNYVIYSLAPATAFTAINNNNYYVSGSSPVIGYIGAADKLTLSSWQTATTQDGNSVSTKVAFLSDSDMHLSGASACNTLLNCPVATEVSLDIDGAERADITKMGVDEVFATLSISSQPASTVSQCVTLAASNTIEIPVGTFTVSAYSDNIARPINVGDLAYTWTRNDTVIAGNTAPLKVLFSGTTLPTTSDVYKATVTLLNESFTPTTLTLVAGPVVFNLTRNGTSPLAIGLSSSESGATYTLLRNSVEVANSSMVGTGSALAFGSFSEAGTYRIKAVKGTCEKIMNDSAVIIQAGYTLSGTIKYANTAQTAMNNCIIIIKSGTTEVGRDTTDATGAYSVSGIANGDYTIEVLTTKAHGGVSAADVYVIRRYAVGALTLTPLEFKAADINQNNSVNPSDVLPIRQKLVGMNPPSWLVAPYVYHPSTVTLSNSNVTLDIQALCGGDVNGSYTPANN